MKDYYSLLGLPRNSTTSEIKSAYRKLSMKFHPDKNSGESFFSDMFRQINEAYEVLADINSRKQYDIKLDEYEHPERRTQQAYKDAQSRLQQELLKERQRLKVESQRQLEAERQRIIAESAASRQAYNANSQPHHRPVTPVAVVSRTRSQNLRESLKWWQGLRAILLLVNLFLGGLLFFAHSKSSNGAALYTARVKSRTGLNLRKNPNASAEIVAKVPYYETVYVLRTDGPIERMDRRRDNWHQVKFDDKIGWLWGGYLEKL